MKNKQIILILTIFLIPLFLISNVQANNNYEEQYFITNNQVQFFNPITNQITKTYTNTDYINTRTSEPLEIHNINKLSNGNYFIELIGYEHHKKTKQRFILLNEDLGEIATRQYTQVNVGSQAQHIVHSLFRNFERSTNREIIETEYYIITTRLITDADNFFSTSFERVIVLNKNDLTENNAFNLGGTSSRLSSLISTQDFILSIGTQTDQVAQSPSTITTRIKVFNESVNVNGAWDLIEQHSLSYGGGNNPIKYLYNEFDNVLYIPNTNGNVYTYDLETSSLDLIDLYAQPDITIYDADIYNNKEGIVIFRRNNVNNLTDILHIGKNGDLIQNKIGLVDNSQNHFVAVTPRDEITIYYTPISQDTFSVVDNVLLTKSLENLDSSIDLAEVDQLAKPRIQRTIQRKQYITSFNNLIFNDVVCGSGCDVESFYDSNNKKLFAEVQSNTSSVSSVYNVQSTYPYANIGVRAICLLKPEETLTDSTTTNAVTEITKEFNTNEILSYDLNGINFNFQVIEEQVFLLKDSEIHFKGSYDFDFTNTTNTIKHALTSNAIQTQLILADGTTKTLISTPNPNNYLNQYTLNSGNVSNSKYRLLDNSKSLNALSPRDPNNYFETYTADCTYTSSGTKTQRYFNNPINDPILNKYMTNPIGSVSKLNYLDYEEVTFEITTSETGNLPETPDDPTQPLPNGNGTSPNGETQGLIDWLFNLFPSSEDLGNAKALFYAIIATLLIMGIGYYASQQQTSNTNSTLTLIITGVLMFLSIAFFTLIGYIPVWLIVISIILAFYFFAKPFIRTDR